MPRRGGKAASRRSRQRRGQRAQPAQPAQRAQPAQPAQPMPVREDELAATDVVSSTDAFEKADAELRASTPPPGSRAEPSGRGASRARPRVRDFSMGSGPSRLSDRAAAEYHYVVRDLRNIGVLMVVMAILLAASAVAVNLLGIGAA